MIGDFGYCEEEAILLCTNFDTVSETSNGFQIHVSSADRISKEKYAIIIKNGLYKKDQFTLNDKMICCRISLENPKYLESDEYLTKEEKEWFVTQISNKWDIIKINFNELLKMFQGESNWDNSYILFEGVKPFTKTDKVPDYSLLPTID